MSAMYCTLCWKVGMMFWWMPVKVSDRSIDQVSYFINRISQVHFMWKQHLSVCGVVWWGGGGHPGFCVTLYCRCLWFISWIFFKNRWEQLVTSEDRVNILLTKGIHRMNAELFEDQAQCSISPLPKHLFDVWDAPPTEINKTNSPIILC